MKELQLGVRTDLKAITGTCGTWYGASSCPYGDLYEAEELFRDGRLPEGRLFLIRFPEAEIYEPRQGRPGVCYGEPVYHDGNICFPEIDFPAGEIRVMRFSLTAGTTDALAVIPLAEIADCYNLRLHVFPLTLSRQPNDGTLDIIWPEKKQIRTGPRDSFFARENDLLYFETWTEDPDYREITIVRDIRTGETVSETPGSCTVTEDGSLWLLKE